MKSVIVDGQELRKATASAEDWCVYASSPAADHARVWDSKTDQSLRMSQSARLRLTRAVIGGLLALGALGILGAGSIQAADAINWNPQAGCLSDCR